LYEVGNYREKIKMDKIGMMRIRSRAIILVTIILIIIVVAVVDEVDGNDEIKPIKSGCMAKCAETCHRLFTSAQGQELCVSICITVKCHLPNVIFSDKPYHKLNTS
jgi:hypothetical protein